MLPNIQELIASFGYFGNIADIQATTSFQCCGITTKKRQCKLRIKDSSILVEIDECNRRLLKDNNPENVIKELKQLVPLFLCSKYHRSQAGPLIEKYEKVITRPSTTYGRGKTVDDHVASVSRAGPSSQSTTRGTALKSEDGGLPTLPSRSPRTSTIVPHPTPRTSIPAKLGHNFERYSSTKSTFQINTATKAVISKVLSDAQMPNGVVGYVYVFTFPECYRMTSPPLKIGFTKDVDTRMRQWKQTCDYTPKLLHAAGVELYKRVEKIVHALLSNQRRREVGCCGCQNNHIEWFEANYSKVAGLIGLWTDWSRQEPYDAEGKLKVEWQTRLDRLDLSRKDCWTTFVNGEGLDDEDDDE